MGISLQPILCERDWLFLLLVVSFFIDVNFINKQNRCVLSIRTYFVVIVSVAFTLCMCVVTLCAPGRK